MRIYYTYLGSLLLLPHFNLGRVTFLPLLLLNYCWCCAAAAAVAAVVVDVAVAVGVSVTAVAVTAMSEDEKASRTDVRTVFCFSLVTPCFGQLFDSYTN